MVQIELEIWYSQDESRCAFGYGDGSKLGGTLSAGRINWRFEFNSVGEIVMITLNELNFFYLRSVSMCLFQSRSCTHLDLELLVKQFVYEQDAILLLVSHCGS